MISGPQAHLMLNHLPIAAFVFLSPILTYLLIAKRIELQKVALIGLALASLLSLPAFWTGEPAEEGIEHRAGVSESLIEAHEEAAELALWFVLITGAGAAGVWIGARKSDRVLKRFLPPLLLLSWVSTGLLARAGHEGGKIRHPEISGSPETSPGTVGVKEEDGDDD